MSNDCACDACYLDVDINYVCDFAYVNLLYFVFYNSLRRKLRGVFRTLSNI